MVSRRDYSAEAVAACKSVLVEVVHLLGEIRDHVVLVGGWVPVLLVTDAAEPHPGTLDIDVALDFRNIPELTYQSILKAFISRGYRQDAKQPFRFFRNVRTPQGRHVEVEVDLLAGEYGGTGRGHRTQVVQDARARKARGCDLAFSSPASVRVEAQLPDGGIDRVTCRVAGIQPWLVMKGMALHDRMKEKDAYDIYYALRYSRGGVPAIVEGFRKYLSEPLVGEGLGKIRAKFQTPEDVGPRWVADFLEIADPADRAIRIRDAFETVTRLLDSLGVEPWVEPRE